MLNNIRFHNVRYNIRDWKRKIAKIVDVSSLLPTNA